MLELTRRSTTKNSGELCLKVPAKDMNLIADTLKQFLRLARYEVQELNEEGEEVTSVDEAFPDTTPADLLRGARFRKI